MLHLLYTSIVAQNCGAGVGECPTIQCCSQWGWCGVTVDHCGTGCQSGFGKCGFPVATQNVCPTKYSTDGRCSADVACTDGNCCSTYGYCGDSESHCVTNCYNQCTGQPEVTLCSTTSTTLFASTIITSSTANPTATVSQVATEAYETETGYYDDNDELVDLRF
eukprot:NODE_670_length_5356_cov_0.415066.p2 type:complete len:164 gc:universal NODE_670_length_5356_cov_0.415066:1670-2161(+)